LLIRPNLGRKEDDVHRVGKDETQQPGALSNPGGARRAGRTVGGVPSSSVEMIIQLMSAPAYPDRVTTLPPGRYLSQCAARSATARFEQQHGELRPLIISASAIGGRLVFEVDRCQVQAGGVPHFISAIALGDAPRSHEAARLGWSRFADRYFLRALHRDGHCFSNSGAALSR
jgi:hypothetical protein